MSNNLTIDLKKCEDQHGKTYYMGQIKAPVLIDCSNGATFFVFVSSEGEEQLQLACMKEKHVKK